MKRVFIILVSAFLILTAGTALAEDNSYNPYDKDYAISFQVGRTYLEDSDFKDFWDLDDTYDGISVSVERTFSKSAAIELSGGYGKYDTTAEDVFILDDKVSAHIKGSYLSLTPKEYLQLSNDFALYIGGGLDYYNVKIELDYDSPLYSDGFEKTFSLLGMHAVAGADVIIVQNPWATGDYDAPVSLFFEYRYSWLKIKEADKDIIDQVNIAMGTSEKSHDFNMGGHWTIIGLKWRF